MLADLVHIYLMFSFKKIYTFICLFTNQITYSKWLAISAMSSCSSNHASMNWGPHPILGLSTLAVVYRMAHPTTLRNTRWLWSQVWLGDVARYSSFSCHSVSLRGALLHTCLLGQANVCRLCPHLLERACPLLFLLVVLTPAFSEALELGSDWAWKRVLRMSVCTCGLHDEHGVWVGTSPRSGGFFPDKLGRLSFGHRKSNSPERGPFCLRLTLLA